MDRVTADLIVDAKEGSDFEFRRLLTHAWRNLEEPTLIRQAAEILYQEAVGNNERAMILIARLFSRAGDEYREREILRSLVSDGFAPAMHRLGTLYYADGDKEEALNMFKAAMQLGFKVGASAYYSAKRRDAHWPLTMYYHLQFVRFRWSSLIEKHREGAADEVQIWRK